MLSRPRTFQLPPFNNPKFYEYNLQKIKEESEAEAKKRNFTTNESKKIPNRRLNR